jgi:sterol desaturase/sphingolipid hydroxylase (fatty acid hydroxylase superfamily)
MKNSVTLIQDFLNYLYIITFAMFFSLTGLFMKGFSLFLLIPKTQSKILRSVKDLYPSLFFLFVGQGAIILAMNLIIEGINSATAIVLKQSPGADFQIVFSDTLACYSIFFISFLAYVHLSHATKDLVQNGKGLELLAKAKLNWKTLWTKRSAK